MKAFKVNSSYNYSLIGDRSIVCKIIVTKKTATMITFIDNDDNLKRAKVFKDSQGHEFIYPDGKYSLCPVCRA